MSFDPTRLTDASSSASSAMRELLRSADADAPSAAQLERLSARLAPQLGLPPPPPPATSAVASGGLSAGTVATIVVVAGVLAVGGWWLTRPSEPAIASPIVAPAVFEEVAVSPPAPPPSPPQQAPVRRVRVAAPAPAATVATPADEPAAPAPAPSEDEVALLGRAKRALRDGDARTALAFTEEHDLSFPSGALVEEREAIGIEALAALGHASDARVRFEQFRASFPRSGYRRRLERLLEEP